MAEKIAPSLATELEQAAVECRRGALEMPDNIEALLTRAAALARAAENSAQAEPLYIDWKRQGYACVVCGAFKLDTCDVAHAADCSWAILRALVSSEGPQEPKQVDPISVGSRWRDNDSRMKHRVVVVERVSDEFVWYRSGGVYRSRRARFLKAFTRVSSEGKGE